MNSTHNPGRVAGFLYLLLVVFAPVRLIYIPSKLFVRGNAAATRQASAVISFVTDAIRETRPGSA